MTRPQAGVVLAELKDAFPYFRMEPATAETYMSFFNDLEQHEGKAVVRRWIATQVRFPTVAEFLQMADSMRSRTSEFPTATIGDEDLATPEEIREALGRAMRNMKGDEP